MAQVEPRIFDLFNSGGQSFHVEPVQIVYAEREVAPGGVPKDQCRHVLRDPGPLQRLGRVLAQAVERRARPDDAGPQLPLREALAERLGLALKRGCVSQSGQENRMDRKAATACARLALGLHEVDIRVWDVQHHGVDGRDFAQPHATVEADPESQGDIRRRQRQRVGTGAEFIEGVGQMASRFTVRQP